VINRISRQMITFPEPFRLAGLSAPVPAGRYEITTEEEPLGDVMYPAFRRISTSIYLPRPPGAAGLGQIVEIGSEEQEALLLSAMPEPCQ
jgi:hypothetical protein